MKAILGDVNIQGHVRILVSLLESEDWRDFWHELNLPVLTFRDLGLPPEATDVAVWRACQQQQVVLLTANRNNDGPDALEATIRAENTPQSLPVFTVADVQEVLNSKAYAERVVARLLEYLFSIENLRGAGRLYLP